jgi:hypothetical protein
VDPQISAGWIGLIGASVGAAGALLGGWFQQRYAAKTAGEQRQEERRYTAGRAALDSLIRLRHSIANRTDNLQSEEAWTDALVEHSSVYDATLLLIPDADNLRERMSWIARVLGHYEILGQSLDEANSWVGATTLEGIKVLSAFLREEPLPEPSPYFLDLQGMVEAHYRNLPDPS